MKRLQTISLLALAAMCVASAYPAWAQQSFYQRVRNNNASMAALQPSWLGPLIQSDARLGQAIRFSVSNSTMPGEQQINYGNNHGISLIAAQRFQLDFNPPSFFRDHSSLQKDGFGNAGTQVKMRLASGNAEHGNFAVSALLYHAFGPRVEQNQLLTAFYVPSIAAGKGFGRFALLSQVGSVLPTAKVAQQGQAIEWNFTAQAHTPRTPISMLRATRSLSSRAPFSGKTQNFLTPAGFLRWRRKDWAPTHAFMVFDAGMANCDHWLPPL